MGSLKQTDYVRAAYGDSGKSTIYYIDIRPTERFENLYQKVLADPNVAFIKSKIAAKPNKRRRPLGAGFPPLFIRSL